MCGSKAIAYRDADLGFGRSSQVKKKRREDDYAKTQVLDNGQSKRPGGEDEVDAAYREYVDTVETEGSEDRTVTHHWRGTAKG